MADFQLFNGTRAVGRRFTTDVGAYDTEACTDLLRRLAVDHKIPLGKALLVSYHNSRKAGEYRAT